MCASFLSNFPINLFLTHLLSPVFIGHKYATKGKINVWTHMTTLNKLEWIYYSITFNVFMCIQSPNSYYLACNPTFPPVCQHSACSKVPHEVLSSLLLVQLLLVLLDHITSHHITSHQKILWLSYSPFSVLSCQHYSTSSVVPCLLTINWF